MIPFLDLKAHHEPVKDELNAAIQEVINSSAFAGGPFVAQFERDFADYCDCPYAIGVGSGTEALWLSLVALGIGPGCEVITVPNTFIATAEAISFCGAQPVFVDVDDRTYTIDTELLEQAITPRTKAIIPVHLFGQTADMDPILEMARKHRLYVIEDACQAHGARYKGRAAGSMGILGCFSFYPGKNLGAFGEAGAVVTHRNDLKEQLQTLRDHGQHTKYHHSVVGWNARMDGIQANVLRVKLKSLDRDNACRSCHARLYERLLGGRDDLILPQEAPYARHIYHLYAIRIRNRDRVLRALADRQIMCGVHYPIPLHLQPAFQGMGLSRGTFPIAEQCADEFLSLPMYPELTPSQIGTVTREIQALLQDTKKERVCFS
jgi:dTDP-4-amino-4,6-dideoxygalactose transaminase